MDAESRILQAWSENAEAWQRAVRERRIESRRLVTDQAILDAAISLAPRHVLDLGCGEGWLVRALDAPGRQVVGIDAEPALIEAAQAAGGGRFECMSYAQVAAGGLALRTDLAICNFCLLGDSSVSVLLAAMPWLLAPHGRLLIQTLHPLTVDTAAYVDGWREGSWQGCGEGFSAPAPWYFRTLEGWSQLFARSDLRVLELREPRYPFGGAPASLLWVLEAASSTTTHGEAFTPA